MLYYLILFLMIISLNYVIKNKKIYALVVSLFLFIMTVFRDAALGLGDTERVYLELYDTIKNVSFSDIHHKYGVTQGLGYVYLTKICTYFFGEKFYFAISILPLLIGAYLFITKYSKNIMLSYMTFCSLFFFFSYVSMRQFFALGLVLLVYYFLLQEKYRLAIFFAFISMFCHFSAFVVLACFIYYKFINKGYFNLLVISLSVIVVMFFKELIIFVIKIFLRQYYLCIKSGVYQIGTMFSLGWFIVLFVYVCLFYFVYHKHKSPITLNSAAITRQNNIMFSILSIGIVTYVLSGVIVEFYRLSYYFSVIIIVLAPNCIEDIKNTKIKNFVSISMMICLVVYFILVFGENANILDYHVTL